MVKTTLPGPNVPVFGADGLINPPWYAFFQQFFARTGGSSHDLIEEIGVSLDDVSATGLFRVHETTPESGATATIEFQVRAGTDEAFRDASLTMSATAGADSFISLDADFVKIDGTLLVNGAVVNEFLATRSATDTSVVETVSNVGAALAAAWVSLATLTSDYTGDKARIDFNVEIANSDSADHLFGVQVILDGVTLYERNALFLAPKNPNRIILHRVIILDEGEAVGDNLVLALNFNGDSTAISCIAGSSASVTLLRTERA